MKAVSQARPPPPPGRTAPRNPAFECAHQSEDGHNQRRGHAGDADLADATGGPDSPGQPHGRPGGHISHPVSLRKDQAGGKERDPGGHGLHKPQRIDIDVGRPLEGQLGQFLTDQQKQAGRERDQHVRPQPRILAAPFPFEPDDTAKQDRGDHAQCHDLRWKSCKVEIELCGDPIGHDFRAFRCKLTCLENARY